MSYDRVIGPPGARAERVTVLDDPSVAVSPNRGAEQLRLFVLHRPQVIMLLGGTSHSGLQGDESVLPVVSPKPRFNWDASTRILYSNVSSSIAVKLAYQLEKLVSEDAVSPDSGRRLQAARINTSLAVIDPSKTDPANQRDFWRAAFWAKDIYPGRIIHSFGQAAELAAQAAQMRAMFPRTLDSSVNDWWLYGGEFATWVMDAQRPDLRRKALLEFRAGKSWQIFNKEMAVFGDPERALYAFPGVEVSKYWKNPSLDSKKDPLYQEIAWPLRHQAFHDWMAGRPSEYFNHWWSINPNADEEVNRVLRTMFIGDIRPRYTEEKELPEKGKIDLTVIADDQTRVAFLKQGITDWSFASNIESASIDRLHEIQRTISPESFYPLFRTALNLAIAYPGMDHPIIGNDRFISSFISSLEQLEGQLSGNDRGVDSQLELYSHYLTGGFILYHNNFHLVRMNQVPEFMSRVFRLRNRLNTATNRNLMTDALVRLGELQSDITILTSLSAIPTRDGLTLNDSITRDPFNRVNWLNITARSVAA